MEGVTMAMSEYSLSDIAAASGDGGFGGGQGWWVIILFALIFGWGGNGWGNRGNCGEPVTQAGLCDAMNFNNLENAVGRLNDTLQAGQRQTDNAVCQLGYQAGQIANQNQRDLCHGFAAVTSALNQGFAQQAQCCCDTQRAIDGVNFNAAMNTAAINANTTEQTQKILDAITGNRMADMQNQINQLQLQAAMCGVVRYPNATTYTAGFSPCFNQACCGSI